MGGNCSVKKCDPLLYKNDECEEGENITMSLYADYITGDLNLDVFDLVNLVKSMLYFMQFWHHHLEYFYSSCMEKSSSQFFL